MNINYFPLVVLALNSCTAPNEQLFKYTPMEVGNITEQSEQEDDSLKRSHPQMPIMPPPYLRETNPILWVPPYTLIPWSRTRVNYNVYSGEIL